MVELTTFREVLVKENAWWNRLSGPVMSGKSIQRRANWVCPQGADLEVFPKEIVALFGKSGSGKTTLLNLLAGLDQPTRGTIVMEGQDLKSLGEKGRTNLRRNRIGFVFQFFNLLPTLTALENVFLP